ncbi:MAG: hypothetical protein Q7T32_12965 [Moraxellaceae bacterium]|nr:hypothetical protein [Moraxellaceae bacterium]
MEQKIQDWLEKSGYPLELYVAAELQKRGYLCSKSDLYVDVNTNQPREIDVVGYHHGFDGGSYVICRKIVFECKKSDKPVLALCASNEVKPKFEYQLFHGDPEDLPSPNAMACITLMRMQEEERIYAVGGFSSNSPSAYSLVSAFSNSDAHLFSGLMGLVTASTYHRRLQKEFFENSHSDLSLHIQDRNIFEFHVACLVVDAPLYNVTLSSSGEPILEKSNWSVAMVQLPWRFNPHDSSDRYCVHVVTKDHLPSFLEATELLANFTGKEELVRHLLSTKPRREGLARQFMSRLRKIGF